MTRSAVAVAIKLYSIVSRIKTLIVVNRKRSLFNLGIIPRATIHVCLAQDSFNSDVVCTVVHLPQIVTKLPVHQIMIMYDTLPIV